MIFSRIYSFFPHDIVDKTEYQLFIIKDSVEITAPDAAVRRHVGIGPSIGKLDHRHSAAQIGGGSHVDLVAFQLTVLQAIKIVLFPDTAVDPGPGLSSLENSGSIQKPQSPHVSAVFHMFRIVKFLSENLETAADADDPGVFGCPDDLALQAALNEPFHVGHGIFGSR